MDCFNSIISDSSHLYGCIDYLSMLNILPEALSHVRRASELSANVYVRRRTLCFCHIGDLSDRLVDVRKKKKNYRKRSGRSKEADHASQALCVHSVSVHQQLIRLHRGSEPARRVPLRLGRRQAPQMHQRNANMAVISSALPFPSLGSSQ